MLKLIYIYIYIHEYLNRYRLKKNSRKVHHKNIKSKLTTFAPFTYVSFCVFYNGRGHGTGPSLQLKAIKCSRRLKFEDRKNKEKSQSYHYWLFSISIFSIESNRRTGSVSFQLAYQQKIISIFDNLFTIRSSEVNKLNVNDILQVSR